MQISKAGKASGLSLRMGGSSMTKLGRPVERACSCAGGVRSASSVQLRFIPAHEQGGGGCPGRHRARWFILLRVEQGCGLHSLHPYVCRLWRRRPAQSAGRLPVMIRLAFILLRSSVRLGSVSARAGEESLSWTTVADSQIYPRARERSPCVGRRHAIMIRRSWAYCHACVRAALRLTGAVGYAGLSPRGWERGKRSGSGGQSPGFILACMWKGTFVRATWLRCGLSPRARGRADPADRVARVIRLIPARAGEGLSGEGMLLESAVYPRA